MLIVGDEPGVIAAEMQVLCTAGIAAYGVYDIELLEGTIAAVNPDLLFFNIRTLAHAHTEAYNKVVTSMAYIHLPVICTLWQGDVYLVTHKRTTIKHKREYLAGDMLSAIQIALRGVHADTETIMSLAASRLRTASK